MADRLASIVTTLVAAMVTAAFAWLLLDVVAEGFDGLSLGFLTSESLNAGRGGGIAPMIVSTAAILTICMVVSVPLGLGTAILLAELTRSTTPIARAVRASLDVLAGVPSIVFGLFGNALFCVALGLGFSILSGGLTLSCMVLPLFIRSAEEALRSVPDDHRRAAAALGMSQTSTLVHVILPVAAPGLAVSIVLGVGRALAETAALLFTSGYVDRMPTSLFDSGRAMSVHIYDLSMNVAGGSRTAYTTALVLVLMLLSINATVSWLGGRWSPSRAYQ